MAKQDGILKIKGLLGDLIFYEGPQGPLVRHKGRLNRSRIKNDPAYVRTRELNQEFAQASRAGKLLRQSQKALLKNTADSHMHGRMLKVLLQVVKSDLQSARGERQIIRGSLQQLEGFELNRNAHLSHCLKTDYTVSIDRGVGQVKIGLPAFVPGLETAAAPGASHLRLLGACSEIDFAAGKYRSSHKKTPWLALNQEQGARQIEMLLKTNWPAFIFLGLEYSQRVNQLYYPLSGAGERALALVKVVQ